MKAAIVVAAALFCSCASNDPDNPANYLTLLPSVQDIPQSNMLRLSYTNETGGKLCIGPHAWPSTGGIVDNNGLEIYLVVKGKRYYLQPESDYCPRCSFEVLPGERINGILKYESFGLPADLQTETKELVFTPKVFRCPAGLR